MDDLFAPQVGHPGHDQSRSPPTATQTLSCPAQLDRLANRSRALWLGPELASSSWPARFADVSVGTVVLAHAAPSGRMVSTKLRPPEP
jgi:hypothetical protein